MEQHLIVVKQRADAAWHHAQRGAAAVAGEGTQLFLLASGTVGNQVQRRMHVKLSDRATKLLTAGLLAVSVGSVLYIVVRALADTTMHVARSLF